MILTLTGASGAGKTTIVKELLNKIPIDTQMVPSYTTRKPRDSDLVGEYKHVNELGFWFLKTIGAFLWTVYPHGNSYGTTKLWAKKSLKNDNTVYVMILTPDAVKKLNSFAEKIGYPDCIFSFFILAPSQEVLRERLKSRGDAEDEIEKRLKDCVRWGSEAKKSGISYEFVKNDSTIESVAKEIIDCFIKKLDRCDRYF